MSYKICVLYKILAAQCARGEKAPGWCIIKEAIQPVGVAVVPGRKRGCGWRWRLRRFGGRRRRRKTGWDGGGNKNPQEMVFSSVEQEQEHGRMEGWMEGGKRKRKEKLLSFVLPFFLSFFLSFAPSPRLQEPNFHPSSDVKRVEHTHST